MKRVGPVKEEEGGERASRVRSITSRTSQSVRPSPHLAWPRLQPTVLWESPCTGLPVSDSWPASSGRRAFFFFFGRATLLQSLSFDMARGSPWPFYFRLCQC